MVKKKRKIMGLGYGLYIYAGMTFGQVIVCIYPNIFSRRTLRSYNRLSQDVQCYY